MPFVLLAFIGFPLIELYVLIQVGQQIGALSTIGICILTAVAGSMLLRHQGLQTLKRARANLDRGEVPALEMLEGAALVVGGILLLTPGLITDTIGFLFLIPGTRGRLVRWLLARMNVRVMPLGGGPYRRYPDADDRDVIEADYDRRDRD